MSILKLCGGKSALGQWQYEKENSEIPKCDEIPIANPPSPPSPSPHPPIKLSQHTFAAVNGICTSSTTTKSLSSPVAANIHNNVQQQQQQQQQQQTYLPQTSLLKIRPFVPSLNARLRRPIGRSYSTLTSSYSKRNICNGSVIHNNNNAIVTVTPPKSTTATTTATITTKTAIATTKNGTWIQSTTRNEAVTKQANNIIVGAAIERNRCPVYSKGQRSFANIARRQTIKVITHQRSKSTSSSAASTSASNRPTTTAASSAKAIATAENVSHASQNASMVAAIVTPQSNGICRIARMPGEQEKLPDRINYDRRGLTAIPIFENEPNLRLLSLQHNLINVFNIPKSESVSDNGAPSHNNSKPPTIDDLVMGENVQHPSHCMRPPQSPTSTLSSCIQQPLAATLIPLSPPMPSPSSSLSQSSIVQANFGVSQLFKRDNFLQSLNLNLNASLMQQKQQLPQQQHHHQRQKPLQRQSTLQHYRFAMKKSKSFINSYSRQVNSAKRNTPMKPPFHKAESKMLMLLGRTNLKSFDSGTSMSGSASALTTNDSLSTMAASEVDEEDAYHQQLEIKNRQLYPFYGTIFQNLVFLDLYDNQIERIANLDGLPSLSVLLLGKNRITDLSGLMSLKMTLRVLDLHGNKITSIGNKINSLQGLKSLNLAGNQIRQINQNDFNGLQNLRELNLKRNRIRRINGFQHLIALERLWLCHNDVHKVDDMSSIAKAISLLEVTIENNPVSLAGDCVSYLVSYLPNLISLSQMPITEQVRKAAMAWRRNKELSEANRTNNSSDSFNHIRREEVISNARTNWELLRSQQTMQAALKWGEQRSPNQRELTKINESNETSVGYEDLQEYIKLPPIQQLQANSHSNSNSNQQLQDEQKDADRLSRSSNSSLGPNVDSSSSSYSSDNEETPKKQNEKDGKRNRNRNNQNHQQQMPMSTRRENRKAVRELQSHKEEEQQNNEMENEFSPEATREGQATSVEKGKALSEIQTASESQHFERTISNGGTNSCERMNSNTQLLKATTDAGCCNVSNNFQVVQQKYQQRAPTSVTAIKSSSNLLYLGYDLESTGDCEAIAVPKTITPMATTTITAIVTTMTSVTTSTTTTCRRYMRGSLMRSQVVVAGVGSYSSNGGHGITTGGVGGAGGALGGKLKLASRNNGILVNGQLNVSSNGPAEAITAVQPPTPALAADVVRKTPPIECTSVIAGNTNTTQTFNGPNATASNAPSTINATSTTVAPSTKMTAPEREREQGGDYLIEICGRYLNIYGQGALRFIDKQWNLTKASDVHTLNFSYINFNNIVAVLSRIKVRFPRAEHFVFRETNICSLGQLNALAELQGITSLFIDPEGNAITTKIPWRQYAIYRLSHWGLKLINTSEISPNEIDEANEMYAGLSDLVLWSMPDVMLHPLLARLRLDETCTASKLSPKEWLMKVENKSLRLVVGKEALQWKKPTANASVLGNSHVIPKNPIPFGNGSQQANSTNSIFNNGQQHQHFGSNNSNSNSNGNNDLVDVFASGETAAATGATVSPNSMALSTRERARMHFTVMMENTCNAIEKLHKLETLWPSLLLDIVRNTLLDYSQLDAYLRNLMADIMK